jgi:23S rRNA maturation-related 3'-5' exoribonuclease YhaM
MADTLISNGVSLELLADTMQSYPFLRENWVTASRILKDYVEGLSE